MAFSFSYRLIGPADPQYREFQVASGSNIAAGDLVKLSTGAVAPAASGDSFLGVALNSAPYNYPGPNPAEIKKVNVLIPLDSVFEVPFSGSVKTSLTDADIGASFDLDSAGSIDLDSTEEGDVTVIDYDNDRGVAYVTINNQLLVPWA